MVGRSLHLFPVIPTAEILFQPHVENDEQIPAAHLLEHQFCFARPPIAPGDGNHRPGVTAHDRLQRNFNREVEMRGDQRPAAVDNCFPVGLERVGRVVERDAEQQCE